jgi:uncharacterized membrane protein YdjX (TVP38/TMEM64 family)
VYFWMTCFNQFLNSDTVLFVPGSILTVGTGFAFGAAMNSPGKGVLLASTVRCSIERKKRLPYSFYIH